MARTKRKRDSDEVVNTARSIKKTDRRSKRKNSKLRIQEVDYQNQDSLDSYEDESNFIKGYN